jgi:cell division septation protein DedD
MTVPDRDSLVLNRAEPSVEQLLPPPETPLPRPTPPEPPAAAEPTPPQAAAPSPAAAPPQEKPEPPSAPAAAAPTSPPPGAAAAPPSEPAPERKTARAAAPPLPTPANGRGYRLQLGSVRTPEAAKKEWDQLKSEQGDLLGSLGFTAERADLGARGIYYRIQGGPIADAAVAERSCNELKRRGVGCLLVKP